MNEVSSPHLGAQVLTGYMVAPLPAGRSGGKVLRIISAGHDNGEPFVPASIAVADLGREDVAQIIRLWEFCRAEMKRGGLVSAQVSTFRAVLYGPEHPWVNDDGDVIVPADWIDQPLAENGRIPLDISYAVVRREDVYFRMVRKGGLETFFTAGVPFSEVAAILAALPGSDETGAGEPAGEDARDGEIARECLSEIAQDSACLVSGEDLDRRLANWLLD